MTDHLDRVQLRSVSGQEAQEDFHQLAFSQGCTPAPQARVHGHPSWPFQPPKRRPPCCSYSRSKASLGEGGSESAVWVSHRGSWEGPRSAWRARLGWKRRQSGKPSQDPGGRPLRVLRGEGPEITSCLSPHQTPGSSAWRRECTGDTIPWHV